MSVVFYVVFAVSLFVLAGLEGLSTELGQVYLCFGIYVAGDALGSFMRAIK
jgi:hypothetical protein